LDQWPGFKEEGFEVAGSLATLQALIFEFDSMSNSQLFVHGQWPMHVQATIIGTDLDEV
jgi:hypothetical protein